MTEFQMMLGIFTRRYGEDKVEFDFSPNRGGYIEIEDQFLIFVFDKYGALERIHNEQVAHLYGPLGD